jgi:leucine-zipper of insertion element IS481
MAHPRAKLTVAGRRLLVERVLELGWPPARAAEAQGVSVATAYKWVRRWRAEGLAGLADRGCRPLTSPRRLPSDRERAILAYRAAWRVGPHRIGWALGEAPSTVHAVLVRHQVPRLGDLDRPTGQVVRYQRQRPGELLHVEVKKQGRIPDGGATASTGAGAPWVASASRAWAMTSSMWPSTTARGWRIWRSTPTNTPRRWPASPVGRWPSTPGWA